MTRYIDADALAERYTNMVERLLLNRGSIVPSDVTTLIVNAPTIDTICGISIDDAVLILTKYLNGELVEGVKCEDCRKQGSDDCPMFNREWRTTTRGNEGVLDFVFHDLTKPSGFCNYGEKKNNE